MYHFTFPFLAETKYYWLQTVEYPYFIHFNILLCFKTLADSKQTRKAVIIPKQLIVIDSKCKPMGKRFSQHSRTVMVHP